MSQRFIDFRCEITQALTSFRAGCNVEPIIILIHFRKITLGSYPDNLCFAFPLERIKNLGHRCNTVATGKYYIGPAEILLTYLNANSFYCICSLTKSRSVNKPQGPLFRFQKTFNCIPCRTRTICHDCSRLTEEGVEQRSFPNIREICYHHYG